MNLKDAAHSVLAEVGKPRKPSEILGMIVERGLWKSEGQTPAATLHAQLAVDIKQNGPKSLFQRVAKGTFALREWGLPDYTPSDRAKDKPQTPGPKKASAIRRKTLSFTDAAEQVLLRFGKKKPMHYRNITEKVLALHLLHSSGQTPEATLYAQILTEISRKTRRGEAPRFVKHGRGYVGLSKWMETGLAFQIEQHNNSVRKKLRAQLLTISPKDFEALIGQLLTTLGFEDVTVTQLSGDDGIDVRGTLVVGDVIQTRMAVQAKRWKRNVQSPVVQQVRGSLGTHEQGLIITTSDFSPGAKAEAERANAVPVALMNGDQLAALLIENNIGVHRTSHDLIELGSSEEE